MLGFSSYSELPFATTGVALAAIAFAGSVFATGDVAAVTTNAKANTTLIAVSSTTIASNFTDVDAQALTSLVGASSTININTFADVDAQANIVLATALATLTASTFADVDAQANAPISTATASGLVSNLADVDAKASTVLNTALATATANTFTDVDAQASTVLSTALATLTANTFTDVDAQATIVVDANNLMQLSFGTAADAYDADASIILGTVTASAFVNAIEDVYLTASITIPSTSAVIVNNNFTDVDAKATIVVDANNLMQLSFGSAADAYDADANTTLQAVYAATAVSNIEDIYLTANPVLASASSSIVNNNLELSIDANISLTTALASLTAGTLDEVDAQANVTLGNALGTLTAGTFADVDAQAAATLSGTESSIVSNTIADVFGQASITVDANNLMQLSLGSAADSYDADANVTLSSTTASIFVEDIVGSISARVYPVSVFAELIKNNISATGVRFPYENYADQYDRKQTLYVLQQPTTNTAYVSYENETQYVIRDNLLFGDTVHILPEDNTVYIKEIPESTTVLIAA